MTENNTQTAGCLSHLTAELESVGAIAMSRMMSDLYEEMKAALRYFDLSFHEMSKVVISSDKPNTITFTYDGRSICVSIDGN